VKIPKHSLRMCIAAAMGWMTVAFFAWRGERWIAALNSLGTLGATLNTIAVSANGGRMPVFRSCDCCPVTSERHQRAGAQTRLPLLADRFTIDTAKHRSTLSVGDLVIFAYFCVLAVVGVLKSGAWLIARL
jgi:hypothetical protein